MNPISSFRTLDDWLAWLETLSPREIVLGLERVRIVIDRLELEQPELVISVGGTNGKGSSVAMLEAMLRRDGKQTACYTSPHVLHYNERIRIDGKSASDEEVISAFKRVEAVRDDVPLTYFEFGTLAALVAFEAAQVDTLILEVGMGGRLDAVNAVEPDACLITNVSLDHCAWLGDDIESIAGEKAGIMRPGKALMFGAPSVPDAITTRAGDLGAELLLAGTDFNYRVDVSDPDLFTWRGRNVELQGLQRPALAGEVQLQNAAAVLAVLEALKFDRLLDREIVNEAFATLQLPGRFQVLEYRKKWVLDVAHNSESARALSESLAALGGNGPAVAVIGMLADKDIKGIVTPLSRQVDLWVAVTVAGSRAENAATLAREIANCCNKPCLIASDIPAALRYADEHTTDTDLVLVTGSFYVVGPALEWLQQNA